MFLEKRRRNEERKAKACAGEAAQAVERFAPSFMAGLETPPFREIKAKNGGAIQRDGPLQSGGPSAELRASSPPHSKRAGLKAGATEAEEESC